MTDREVERHHVDSLEKAKWLAKQWTDPKQGTVGLVWDWQTRQLVC